jgi:hypothetical protein
MPPLLAVFQIRCYSRSLMFKWKKCHCMLSTGLLQSERKAMPPVQRNTGDSMKVHRTVVGCVTLTVVVSVSACTSPSSSTVPTIFSPSVSASATSSGFYSGTASVRPTPSGSHSARPTNTASPTPSASPATRPASQPAHSPSAPSSTYPTSAPSTGGGGTAGLQDRLLFGIGGVAVLLGVGSLAYRRRVIRSR